MSGEDVRLWLFEEPAVSFASCAGVVAVVVVASTARRWRSLALARTFETLPPGVVVVVVVVAL